MIKEVMEGIDVPGAPISEGIKMALLVEKAYASIWPHCLSRKRERSDIKVRMPLTLSGIFMASWRFMA